MKALVNTMMAFLILLLITSCAGPYTMDNSGSTINLGLDDPFEIQLVSNASTGYSWSVVSYDSTVIQQVGEKSYEADNDKVGSAGLSIFNFKTVGEGETTLTLVYKRNWEEHALHDKTFEMKIVAGTMGRIEE